jgi:myo-inositol-1(or 4)-monophosphatase
MNRKEQRVALGCAMTAAKVAGELMRQNLHSAKAICAEHLHDIKLELDAQCQELIEYTFRDYFPDIPILGEEGTRGDPAHAYRWVVDPIDGTVNFAHGVPHACVCIALQVRSNECRVTSDRSDARNRKPFPVPRVTPHVTLLGVVFDPFANELWTAVKGQPARLNSRVIQVSRRHTLGEAMVSIGFPKSKSSIDSLVPCYAWLAKRVRKVRIMGSAGLALTYVAMPTSSAASACGISPLAA